MRAQRRIAGGMVLLPLLAWASGCDNSAATLRVVHASIDASALDVYARNTGTNTATLFSNVAYAATTPYQKISREGDYVFELRPAGAPAASAPLTTSSVFHVSTGENATAVIAGLAGTGDSNVGLQVLVEEERFDLPAPTDNAWVRVVNAVPDVESVEFIATSSDGTSTTTGSLDRFGAASILEPVGQPLGIGAAPVGTSFTVTLTSKRAVFLIATGLSTAAPGEDQAFELLQVGIDGSTAIVQQDPIVYALAASPDAASLDLFNGTTEVASGVAFGQLSSIQLPPGDQAIDFFPHSPTNARPAGDPTGSVQLGGLEAGKRYLSVTSGFVTTGRAPALQSSVYQEAFAAAATTALLRVVQAAPDLPTVDLASTDGMSVMPFADFHALSFLDSSTAAGTAVPNDFTLAIVPSGTQTVTAGFALASQASTRSFAVVAGAATPAGSDQPLGLILVDTTSQPWVATSVAAQ